MEKLLPNDKVPRAAMQVVQDCLVVSVQVELYEETLVQLRTDLLEHIRISGVRKAIFDLSSVNLLDPHAYNSICDTANMARVMGTHAVVAGIRPGVASALVELGVDVRRAAMALNLEDGFEQLERLSSEELEFEQLDPEIAEDDEVQEGAHQREVSEPVAGTQQAINAGHLIEPDAGSLPPPEGGTAGQ